MAGRPRRPGRAGLGADLLAGSTTAAMVVPQAVAYASLSGLPVEPGLYVATAAVAVLALTVLAPPLADLPLAVLGAIILVSAIGLVDLAPLWRIRPCAGATSGSGWWPWPGSWPSGCSAGCWWPWSSPCWCCSTSSTIPGAVPPSGRRACSPSGPRNASTSPTPAGSATASPPWSPPSGRRQLARPVPAVEWLAHYRRGWLRGDVLAALTTWALVVPQAIAYAQIADLPPRPGCSPPSRGCSATPCSAPRAS